MNLTFQFADAASFFAMGGHAPFVWSCYAVTLAGVAFLMLEPGFQRRRFIRQQQNLARRKAQAQQER